MPPLIDRDGQRYGSLTVVGRSSETGRPMWICRCDCGQQTVVASSNLAAGNSQSCGYCNRSERQVKHGHARKRNNSPEYRTWTSIIGRCESPKRRDFKYYGGRGITICDRWRRGEGGKTGFECFLADMGRKPSPELSIEREDNDRGYEPDNCVWATRSEQMKNRRYFGKKVKPGPKITYEIIRRIRLDGRPQHVIAAELGMTQGSISRIKTGKAWSYVD